jgi:hypothetical protein
MQPGAPPLPVPTTPIPVVVNEVFARRYFPDANPLGQQRIQALSSQNLLVLRKLKCQFRVLSSASRSLINLRV